MFYIKRNYWLLLSILITAIILIACFIPARNVPKMNVPLMDKWVHVLIFSGFSFCWSVYFSSTSFSSLVMLLLACAAFGLSIEMVQGAGWISNRSFEWNDLWADIAGAIAGGLLYRLIRKRRPPKPGKKTTISA